MKKVFVKLKQTDSEKAKPVPFEIEHANSVLSLSNSCWRLSDEGFEWNGTEIAKKSKK